MKQSILDSAITGKIQGELWRLGYKCHTTQNLVLFTDKPFHKNSKLILQKNVDLTEPYMTTLGYKTACKAYAELKTQTEV